MRERQVCIQKDTYYGLADEADCLKGGDFEICVGLIIDEAQEELDELWPVALGEFYGGDSGDDCGRKVSGLLRGRAESEEGILLDLGLCFVGETEPPAGVLLLASIVLESGEENW